MISYGSAVDRDRPADADGIGAEAAAPEPVASSRT